MESAENIASEIIGMYRTYGKADYIGEPVSQLEHMSQSAQLAIREGCDDMVILAAFFHDIGHICVQVSQAERMDAFGNKNHEKIGADFLRSKGFPEQVTKLVENHVAAKRYLTFRHAAYYNALSDASKKTLEFQGGCMTPGEAEQFEQDPYFNSSILIRHWDDEAKNQNIPIIDLEIIKEKIEKVLQNKI